MRTRYTGPWAVYFLVDARDGTPFYVGCSYAPESRLKAHARDWLSCAKQRCDQIRDAGGSVDLQIMGWFTDKREAQDEEARLIRETESVVNLTRHRKGCQCHWHAGIDPEKPYGPLSHLPSGKEVTNQPVGN